MSFGVVQSAISSIKSNRNLLSKRGKLKNTLSSSESKKLEFKSANASPYELKKLGKKLQQEHKKIRIKQLVVLSLIMLVLISIFIYCL